MKLTHREHIAVIAALISDLPDSIPDLGRSVNSQYDREQFAKAQKEALSKIDRIKEHILAVTPWNA